MERVEERERVEEQVEIRFEKTIAWLIDSYCESESETYHLLHTQCPRYQCLLARNRWNRTRSFQRVLVMQREEKKDGMHLQVDCALD